eukprot:CAMPEP_0203908556 /NCGR_PEP_ID=MMETSP0359-20131031/49932_1 /ASSEMBLY_ACC=CAM_ASM_000338 /TAXON_ID=268821 /ORGANISM="Scrippsiella Hangoei, Strain SHTV-5" /LENGTH=71 /DNA_ID=CAMNT_0050833585 /DNA_START=131 /DNA_END=346 /DNA_ORIENTATION=+
MPSRQDRARTRPYQKLFVRAVPSTEGCEQRPPKIPGCHTGAPGHHHAGRGSAGGASQLGASAAKASAVNLE